MTPGTDLAAGVHARSTIAHFGGRGWNRVARLSIFSSFPLFSRYVVVVVVVVVVRGGGVITTFFLLLLLFLLVVIHIAVNDEFVL